MEISIFKHTGEKTSKNLILSPQIFDIIPNDHSICLDVWRIMANKRQGTHKSKERKEIHGSTRKLRKQKGTGNARVGSIKSPIFRGGGRVFGPRPRKYSLNITKKTKVLAQKSALTYKAKENNIIILEDFIFDNPKTKKYIKILESIKVNNVKTLLLLSDYNFNILFSSNNLKKAKVSTIDFLNTYDILNAEKLIICESSFEALNNKYIKS